MVHAGLAKMYNHSIILHRAYILTGELLIKAQLNIKTLTFIRSLLLTQPTQEIILRQYVMKDSKTHSQVKIFKENIFFYELPSILQLYVNTPTKAAWKTMVKIAVIRKQDSSSPKLTKTSQP